MNPADPCEELLSEFADATRWVVAFSGGLDSSVLLHRCQRLLAARPEGPQLLALHVNHGVQADAASWQQHCAAQCLGWGVAFEAHPLGDGEAGSSEDDLRRARYRVFEQVCTRSDLLLLAHHLDDQAETVLLRLARGAGPAGLAGMPRRRNIGAARLCRPLLQQRREQLLGYALEQGISWIEDPSNQRLTHDRNYLRSAVLPALDQRWPGVAGRIVRASGHCAEAQAICEERAREDLGAVCLSDRFGAEVLSIGAITRLTRARANNLLRTWLRDHGLRADTRLLDTLVRELIGAAADRSPRLQLDGASLRRFGDGLYLLAEHDGAASPAPRQIAPGFDAILPGAGRVALQRSQGGVRTGNCYEIRFRAPGLNCRLSGRPGRSLKKVLQDYAVPPWLRHAVPLLYVDGELAAIADLAICEGFTAAAAEQSVSLHWQPGASPGLTT